MYDDVIEMQNFIWYGFNRKNIHKNAPKGSGGVGFLIHNSIMLYYDVNITDMNYEGILVIKLTHKWSSFTFFIVTCYLPPENSPWGREAEAFYSHLLSLLYSVEFDNLIICGDFNSRIGNIMDYVTDIDSIPVRQVIDKHVNQHGKCLIDFLIESKLCILNGRISPENNDFTNLSSRGTSVVDYIIVPHDKISCFRNFQVISCKSIIEINNLYNLLGERSRIPDHAVLYVEMRSTISNSLNDTIISTGKNMSKRSRVRYKFNNLPIEFCNNVNFNEQFDLIVNQINVNSETQVEVTSVYNNICYLLDCELSKYVQVDERKYSKNNKKQAPFWNDILYDLWAQMRQNERNLKKNKFVRVKQDLWRIYKESQYKFDKEFKRCKRLYNRGLMLKIEYLNSSHPKQFWSEIKKIGPRKNTLIPAEIKDDNGLIVSNKVAVLERWKTDFCNLYQSTSVVDVNFTNSVKSTITNYENNFVDPLYINHFLYNNELRTSEVTNIIKKSKNGKAAGIDNLPYEVYKNDSMCNLLKYYFQLCFDTGIVPDQWLRAIILPVPKSNMLDRYVPLNYRGISLLCTCAKLYSSVLNQRLTRHLEEKKILADEQNGFRSNRSCLDHVFTLYSIIKGRMENNLNTFAAFIDFKKAFDLVNRNYLLYKILNIGIEGKLYFAIKSLLTNTRSCVRVNDYYTDYFDINTGIRQGDGLSSTLFACFINDLVTEINNCQLGIQIGNKILSCLLYADDFAIMAENEQNLQSMLICLSEWCKKWDITININKSNVIHFRPNRRKNSEFMFHINTQNILYVDCYKYLGVYMDAHLKMNVTIKKYADSGSRALGAIITKYKQMPYMCYKTYTKLFDACVYPILDYCSPIWSHCNCNDIDDIQYRAMRVYLGINRYAAKIAIIGDMGWMPGNIRRKIHLIRYWNRLISLQDDRITKVLFLHDYNSNNNTSICHAMKLTFIEINMENVYNSLTLCNIDDVKSKLLCIYQEKWYSEIINKPKLRFYKKFKKNYCTESYLLYNSITRIQRSYLTQLRLGILQINVEIGRYKNMTLEKRICNICDSNDVEDEIHFLFTCKTYKIERTNWFSKMDVNINILKTVTNDYNELLQTIFNYPSATANYVIKCIEKRKSILCRQ